MNQEFTLSVFATYDLYAGNPCSMESSAALGLVIFVGSRLTVKKIHFGFRHLSKIHVVNKVDDLL